MSEEEEIRRCKWWVHYPGEVYANDMDFIEPATREDAVEYALNYLSTKKKMVCDLPEGTEIWPGSR